ncbi:Mov34/MPN/PAD-1 family protein [Sphingomonas sp.]|uniref:Mov34/MPN/PAD-1 family protein n=1 Tax=Sphingomonas sp. TaxID=28214 RepID=UPI003AFF8646
MAVAISSAVLARLHALAAASPEAEICGLLLGAAPERIDAAPAAVNVADAPATRFELDPATLFAALRGERAGRARVLGHYHSHPSGTPDPSPCDAASADGAGGLWLILAAGEARLWRAVAGGPLHGAFAPVTLVVEPVAETSATRQKGVKGWSGDV